MMQASGQITWINLGVMAGVQNNNRHGERKMEEIDIDPYWRLSDTLTVYQAAGLIAGYDPIYMFQSDSNFHQQFPRLEAVESALRNAIIFCLQQGDQGPLPDRRTAKIAGACFRQGPVLGRVYRRCCFCDD